MRTAVLILCFLLSGVLRAQQPLTLDTVLKQLQTHLEEYRATVPDHLRRRGLCR